MAQSLETLLPWLVAAWLTGVWVMCFRLFVAWRHVCRLAKCGGQLFSPPGAEGFIALKHRLGIARPVRLVKSALIEVPTVIGWLRPVILLPGSCMMGLSVAELDSILVHELAHIRRHDYLVNVLQSFLEAVLFYHPAVWWVSAQVREERENCCDDVVVQLCGNPLAYARALTTLAELRATAAPGLAMAADGGSLLRRIRRLLGLSGGPCDRNYRRASCICLLAILGLGVAGFLLWLTTSTESRQQLERLPGAFGDSRNHTPTVQKEPSFEGKPMHLWLQAYLEGNRETWRPATAAFRHMGPHVLPGLVEMLQSKGTNWGLAVRALHELGPDAKAAIPELVALFGEGDSGTAWNVVQILDAIGPAALLPLKQALSNTNPQMRYCAAIALGGLGAASEPAIPTLVENLKDTNSFVRLYTAAALVRLQKAAPGINPVLDEGLQSTNLITRRWMVAVCGLYGPKARSATGKLLEFATDPECDFRQEVVEALKKIDPEAATREGLN